MKTCPVPKCAQPPGRSPVERVSERRGTPKKELRFSDTSTWTDPGEIVFEAGPDVTGYVRMQQIERKDIEQLKYSAELHFDFKTGHNLLSRLPFLGLDFFLLFYEEDQRWLNSIALYVFYDFQSNGRGASR